MIIDRSDNTVCIAEGGVWVTAEAIAEETGATEEEVMTWLEDCDYKDWITQVLVDKATEMFVELYNEDDNR